MAFKCVQPVWAGTPSFLNTRNIAQPIGYLRDNCDGSQVGHQAAQCTNGTINWKGIYGEDAFVLKEPLYHSDYSRIAKEKQVDLTALEARARQYAKVCFACLMFHPRHVLAEWPSVASFQEKCEAAGMDYDEVVSQAVVWQGAVPAAGDTATAAVVTQDADNKPSAGEE